MGEQADVKRQEEIAALASRRGDATWTDADDTRLSVLRFEAGKEFAVIGAGPNPPAPAVDLFDGLLTIPEVDAADVTGEVIASGLRHHGALIVRGLVDADGQARIGADLATGESPALYPAHPVDDAGEPVREAPVMACKPGRLEDILGIYRETGMLGAIEGYMGERSLVVSERVQISRRTEGIGLHWHQDAAFYGGTFGAVNVWLALTPCGTDRGAPGLSIVARRFDKAHGVVDGEKADLRYMQLDKDELLELANGHEVASPTFDAGDAILLDEMTMHRTQRLAWTIPEKLGAITWFFPASRFPTDYSPMLV